MLAPGGRQHWDLDSVLGMREVQRTGLERVAYLHLEWHEPDVARQAAEGSRPICRRETTASLLEDGDGGLLHVDGDGPIWPPIARA